MTVSNPWATVDDAKARWPEAALGVLSDDRISDAIDAAFEVLVAGPAPALEDGDPVPIRYTEAVVMHARDTWGAFRRDTGDVIGFDGYAVRARPVSAAVLGLLRPPAPPRIG